MIIAARSPRLVVGGHNDPKQSDDAMCIAETKACFADLLRLNDEMTGREELYKAMLDIHGSQLDPRSLWGATAVLKDPMFAS